MEGGESSPGTRLTCLAENWLLETTGVRQAQSTGNWEQLGYNKAYEERAKLLKTQWASTITQGLTPSFLPSGSRHALSRRFQAGLPVPLVHPAGSAGGTPTAQVGHSRCPPQRTMQHPPPRRTGGTLHPTPATAGTGTLSTIAAGSDPVSARCPRGAGHGPRLCTAVTWPNTCFSSQITGMRNPQLRVLSRVIRESAIRGWWSSAASPKGTWRRVVCFGCYRVGGSWK